MGIKFGYSRVSSMKGQKHDRQLAALMNEGIEIAKSRGRFVGGKPKLNQEQIDRLQKLRNENGISIAELQKMFSISRGTVYKYLKA